MIYDLKYTGLMAVEDLKIVINFEQSYDFMRTKVGLNAVVLQAEIDTMVEELQRNELIKIDDTVRTLELSTPEAIEARRTRIDTLVKELATGAFFRPALTPGKPAVDEASVFGSNASDTTAGVFAQGVPAAVGTALASVFNVGGPTRAQDVPEPRAEDQQAERPEAANAQVNQAVSAAGQPRAAFSLRQLSQRERRTVTYDLSRTTAMQRPAGPQNLLAFMASPRELQSRITRIGLNHPFFARLRIDVEAGGVDFAAEGVRELTVNLRYGLRPDGRPKQQEQVILRTPADRASFTFARDATAGGVYEFQLTVHYVTDFGIGDERDAITGPWTRSEARTLAVHPKMVANRRAIEISLPRMLPPDLDQVRLTVAYSAPEARVEDREGFVLSPAQPTQRAVVRYVGDEDKATITGQAHFADGSVVAIVPVVRPDPEGAAPDDSVVLRWPERPAVRFEAILSDPFDEIRSVLLEYRVFQDDAEVAQGAVELTEALQPKPVVAVLDAAEPRPRVETRMRTIFDFGRHRDRGVGRAQRQPGRGGPARHPGDGRHHQISRAAVRRDRRVRHAAVAELPVRGQRPGVPPDQRRSSSRTTR